MPNHNDLTERTGCLETMRFYGSESAFGQFDDGTNFRIPADVPEVLRKFRKLNPGERITIWGVPEPDKIHPDQLLVRDFEVTK